MTTTVKTHSVEILALFNRVSSRAVILGVQPILLNLLIVIKRYLNFGQVNNKQA